MAITLSKKTAQKIVETVKDVCGYDINFINTDGIIFASTNESRIGDFHEIGKKVIDTQEILEVETDQSFYGTNKGVNIPFAYKGEMIAAIGISGVPNEVRPYALLAQKITTLILREQELDSIHYGYQNQMRSVVHSLIEGKTINQDFLQEFLTTFHLELNKTYRTILLKIDSRYHPSNITMLDNEINQFFAKIPSAIHSFHFPNEYWLILTNEDYKVWQKKLQSFATDFQKILRIGIGAADSIHRQNVSYSKALIAYNSLQYTGKSLACYDDLTLEILTGSIPTNVCNIYFEKTISNLDPEDIQLLLNYFQNNLSLKETAAQMYVHKNTIQYQLNRIHQITGYNPRQFKEAVILYMACNLYLTSS